MDGPREARALVGVFDEGAGAVMYAACRCGIDVAAGPDEVRKEPGLPSSRRGPIATMTERSVPIPGRLDLFVSHRLQLLPPVFVFRACPLRQPQAAAASPAEERYASPLASIAQAMRASLLASATAASLRRGCAAIRRCHAEASLIWPRRTRAR